MRRRFSIIFGIILFLLVGTGLYFALPQIFGSVVVPLPQEFQPIIRAASQKYGIDSCLIAAVIRGESNWNPKAGSRAGAQGLMQVVPGTAGRFAQLYNIPYSKASDLHNPTTNIDIGTSVLHYNFRHYKNLRDVLVAYNAGGARVGQKVLPRETQGYIVKIPNYYELYKTNYPDFCTTTNLASGSGNLGPAAEDFADFPTVDAPVQNVNINDLWKAFLGL